MTVGELIEKLQKVPQDAEVDAYVYYNWSNHACCAVTGVEVDDLTDTVTICAEN